MSRRSSERFSAIPVRVDEAIDRGELTPRRGEILKRLIYRCGRSGSTTFTLVELREWLRGFEGGTEALRRNIVALEKGGWVSIFRTPGRGQSAWQLSLSGAAVGISVEFNSTEPPAEGRRNLGKTLDAAALDIPPAAAKELPTDRDLNRDVNPDRPVGEIASGLGRAAAAQAAAALADEIRPEHRDAGTRAVILAYANELPVDEIRAVHQSLISQRRPGHPRNEGKWVNGALGKRARKLAGARSDAA